MNTNTNILNTLQLSLLTLTIAILALFLPCSTAQAHHTVEHSGYQSYQLYELRKSIECQKFLVRDPTTDFKVRCP